MLGKIQKVLACLIPPIIGVMGSFLVFNYSAGFSFLDFLKMIFMPFLLEESYFYHKDMLIALGTLWSWLGIMTLLFRMSYIVPEKFNVNFVKSIFFCKIYIFKEE